MKLKNTACLCKLIIFHNSKNRKKSRIQPNSKFFWKKYFTKHAYLTTIKNILGVRCTLNSLCLDLKTLFVRVKLTDLFLIEIIKRSVTFISNKEHMNFRHRFELKFSFFKQNYLKISFLRINRTTFSPCLMYNLHLPVSL